MIKKWFTEHPHQVGETYIQHLLFAGKAGCSLVIAGFACLVHAVFPCVCKNTASKTIQHLYDCMQKRHQKI